MCGIAGLVKPSETASNLKDAVTSMAQAIEHRGPDGMGAWVNEESGIAFSHRRLSIQDLSESGSQPMISPSKRYTITFNGEIYNFQSVRITLVAAGYHFRGHSDTEVLLSAIEEWGVEGALAKIKGMFAFGLWDSTLKTLSLVRDRIGEKPLYYGKINGVFLFGSELKALYAHTNPRNLTIDKVALASYLRYGYISAPNSIFQEIKKLEPGHILTLELKNYNEFDLTTTASKVYWCVKDSAKQVAQYAEHNIAEAVGELDSKLNQIIQEQSIADVPLGAFLSGGIDSSVVSAILQVNSSRPIDTFTIGFKEKSFNEAEYAKEIAKHLGTVHHELYLEQKDILGLIESLPHIYDEPFADASQLPTIMVNRFAKTQLTVCLSGDGGDELFAGYNRYVFTENVLRKTRSLPPVFKAITQKLITSITPGNWDRLYDLLNLLARRKGGAEFGNKLYKILELANISDVNSAYIYLMSYWQSPGELLESAEGEIEMNAPLDLNTDFLNAAMSWDQAWYLPGDNLAKTDRASMSCSLELRAPLLDIDLIDFAWRVSPELKIKDGKSKWLLREVLYQYVPRELIDRPKMGFSVPISKWIREDLKFWVDDLLSEQFISRQNIFKYEPVKQALEEHRRGTFDHGKKLWTLLMFQAWYKKYLDVLVK